MALPERIAKRVDLHTESGCWIWTGASNATGYGYTSLLGEVMTAHRAVYRLLVGPVREGQHLHHVCETRLCVNPEHLEPIDAGEHARLTDGGRINREKTHCPYGHPYSEENTRRDKHGWRWCRECARTRNRAYKQAKREAAPA